MVKLPETLVPFLYDPLPVQGENPLIIEPRGNLVRKFTWKEVAGFVTVFARGMLATDFKQGKRVAIICNTTVNSFVACMANLLNGCINVMIPKDAGIERILNAIADSRAQALIIDSTELAGKILDGVHLLPELRQVILLDKAELPNKPEILCANWDDILQRSQGQPDRLSQHLAAQDPHQEAFLFFMPDTDGELIGVQQTHAQIIGYLKTLLMQVEDAAVGIKQLQRTLAVLPFHHPYSWVAGLLFPLYNRQEIMALDRNESWRIGSLPFKPQMVVSDATFFDMVARTIEQAIQSSSTIERALLTRSLQWMRKREVKPGQRRSFGTRLCGRFFHTMMIRRIREQLGGDIDLIVCVDSDLSADTRNFFYTLGIEVLTLPARPTAVAEAKV